MTVVLGDTERTPNQGPTIASETIQITAKPLARAAATARAVLLARAAVRLGVPAGDLRTLDGAVLAPEPDRRALSYGDLIGGERILVRIDPDAPLKPVVGLSHRRPEGRAGRSAGQGHGRACLCA